MAASKLAHLYCDDDRWDEAERWLEYGCEVPVPYFTRPGVLRLTARARVAAHRGDFGEAVALTRRAVELAEPTDMLNFRADTWASFAARLEGRFCATAPSCRTP